MRIKLRAPKLSLLLALSLALISSGCVTIREGTACTVAGELSQGLDCTHFIAPTNQPLTFKEAIDMLEAQGERSCVPVPGMNVCKEDQSVGVPVKLPARAGAVITPSADFGTLKTEVEIMCRKLGKRCSYETQALLARLGAK